MTGKQYDLIFVTHLPSFYKVNLYREIAQHKQILVIYIGSGSAARTQDFTTSENLFDSVTLYHGAFEQRSKMRTLWRLGRILKQCTYQQLVLGGWELPEFWLLAWLQSKHHNYLVLESSVYESKVSGLKALIKRLFLSRMSSVYYAGQSQYQLLQQLRFQGKTTKTGGVGLMHFAKKRPKHQLKKIKPSQFLYVGRLAPEKNLRFLINCFQQLSQYQLTIVGSGPLEHVLKQEASSNVRFLSHVPNSMLSDIYDAHDIFILPSVSEPWGLVVEEALFHGLPIVASKTVGAAKDLIASCHTGVLFDPTMQQDCIHAIQQCVTHFDKLQKQVQQINWQQRAQAQVLCYCHEQIP